MATNGVKIVDSDTAHDTYWGIMDLYDSGLDFPTIEEQFPIVQPDFADDFDNEIYVTSCALAFWEIGQMTEDKLAYVKLIIEKGAGTREWSITSNKLAEERQKELGKFLKKISRTNAKITPRKKYRKISKTFFNSDDILAFQLKDDRYKSVICVQVDQYRGNCVYSLVPTTYDSLDQPTSEELVNFEVLGRQISGSSFDPLDAMQEQPGIERIWKYLGSNGVFFFGIDHILVSHTDMAEIKKNFKVVGKLQISDSLKRGGTFGYQRTFVDFENIFSDLDGYVEKLRLHKFPLKILEAISKIL
ncbi:MAG: hypothetical protein ACKO96_13590, partial [Flammeovirgaceae bacterium]